MRGRGPQDQIGVRSVYNLDKPGTEPTKKDYPAICRAVQNLPELVGREDQIALLSITGSYGYGLAHTDSDLDVRGIFLAPQAEVLGLYRPPKHLTSKKPDVQLFELGQFLDQMQQGNPNMLEILWAQPVWNSELGEVLRDYRTRLLSQQLRARYAGFAHTQMKEIKKIGLDDANRKKREKHVRHLFRIYEQGYDLLTTGDMSLKVQDPQRLQQLSLLSGADLQTRFDELDHKFQTAPSPLPEHVDLKALNHLLVSLRLKWPSGQVPRVFS